MQVQQCRLRPMQQAWPRRRPICRATQAGRQTAQLQQVSKASSPMPVTLSSGDRHDWLGPGDADKESSRKFRRVTFDHEGWAKHRSTGRYWRHIRSMTRSRIVKGLAGPLAYVGIVATLVCCYEALLEQHMLPDLGFPWPGLAVSTTGVYSLSTFALSLLLVFRTNSSYQRWNDARKLWGLTTNRCRDLGRQVTQWMADPADAELAAAACRLIKAFPVALMASLRSDHDLRADLAVLLEPQELQLILQQPHVGTAILQALGAQVAASRAKEVQKLRIDENITVLQDTMGGCERIFRTPIPLVYTRHTSRFLLCWLTILPFCTAGQVGWLTVPIACGMAFFLLGIEEIGVQVEEPFGILALELFCENIAKNIQQAQDAAAAMRMVAAAHAVGTMQGPSASAVAGGSSSGGGSSTGDSSGSSSSMLAPLQHPPGLQVAGQSVPAAEQAHGMALSLPVLLPPTAAEVVAMAGGTAAVSDSFKRKLDDASSTSGNGVAEQGVLGPGSVLSTALTSGSMASREYDAAEVSGAEASELAAYWPSSVSSGVTADASEDPF